MSLVQDIARIGRIPEQRVEEILREAEEESQARQLQDSTPRGQ